MEVIMNSVQLKVIALILMTLDHIHHMLGNIMEIPSWFNLLGRLSAPIFIFMCANGYRYTHNKLAYIRRLYLWAAAMNVGNFIANTYFEHPNEAMIINSIFGTMFYIVYYLYSIELIKNNPKETKKIIGGIFLVIIPILLSGLELAIMGSPQLSESPYFRIVFLIVTTVLPTPILVEGSFIWILLGAGIYFCLDNKWKLSIFYIFISAFFFAAAVIEGFTITNLFVLNNQWFMIFTLPFLLSYNKEKGRSMKYFFYLYYPLHIYILLGIAHMLS